jgi:aryl sulfotransferase
MEPSQTVFDICWPEVRGDAQAICTRLSAAGFDDLATDGLLVLAAMAASRPKVEGLLRKFAISEQTISATIDALVLRGYLENRGKPDGIHPATRALTKRGHAAVAAISRSVEAMRWANFPFREGDIVISAPVKSGMTWTQMICALLIFQTPDLPAPLSKLSPWLDWNGVSRDEVYAQLASQQHRRFIKTHSPLKAILKEVPAGSRATYIVVARHPLDAVISMYYQRDNFAYGGGRPLSGPPEPDRRPPPTPREWLIRRLAHYQASRYSEESGQAEFADILWHLSDAWARRSEPNVVLLHYEDLSTDLEGQMRALAARLAVTVPDPAWPDLVKAATFEQMRAAANRLQPVGMLKDNTAFFRRGTSGSGRELLNGDELARYHAHTARLIPADLFTWLHRGEMARGC